MKLNVKNVAVAIVGCGLLLGSDASAQNLFMSLGNYEIDANGTGSFGLDLLNTGADLEVTGISFNLQVADTGPDLAGAVDGPEITGVDLWTGTPFQDNNNGMSGTGAFAGGQLWNTGTLTSSGTTTLPTGGSLAATLSFDATGFDSGVFDITLDTLNEGIIYTTTGADIDVVVTDGTLTIVPEPQEYALMVGAGLGLLVLARRKGWLASLPVSA